MIDATPGSGTGQESRGGPPSHTQDRRLADDDRHRDERDALSCQRLPRSAVEVTANYGQRRRKGRSVTHSRPYRLDPRTSAVARWWHWLREFVLDFGWGPFTDRGACQLRIPYRTLISGQPVRSALCAVRTSSASQSASTQQAGSTARRPGHPDAVPSCATTCPATAAPQRANLLDNINADYVRTARPSGLTRVQAIRRHARVERR